MTTLPFPKDTLLFFSRVILKIMIWGTAILGVFALISSIAIFGHMKDIAAALAANAGSIHINGQVLHNVHIGSDFRLILTGLLVCTACAMLLVWFFLKFLDAIVNTVAAGDPFVPENADRLRNMGWLMLVIQLVMAPAMAWLEWCLLTSLGQFGPDFHINGSGLLMVLTLFILARVFYHGAAMRQDLEGTV